MATTNNLPELGLWVNNEFFGKESPEEGHREIALKILGKHRFWKEAFERNPNYIDPVDWLIYRKSAIKVGSKYGDSMIYYASDSMDREGWKIISLYESMNWKTEDQAQRRWQIEQG